MSAKKMGRNPFQKTASAPREKTLPSGNPVLPTKKATKTQPVSSTFKHAFVEVPIDTICRGVKAVAFAYAAIYNFVGIAVGDAQRSLR